MLPAGQLGCNFPRMVDFLRLTRGRIIGLAILVVLVGAYALVGFFAVPRLLRSNATEFVATEYGRKLEVGEIRFNPFTLVLRVRDLSFPDSEGQPLVGFRGLLVNFNVPVITEGIFRIAN